MNRQRKSYLIFIAILLAIAVICILLMGCAAPKVQYRKSCWEIALAAAAGARYELGLTKQDIRVATGYKEWSEKRHAWAEVRVSGQWYRIGDGGAWFFDSPWQYGWTADKYYSFDAAFDIAKRFGPRKK